MNVEIRGDAVVITGYVNAIERYSKPITSKWREKIQTFVERVKAGTFKTALKRNEDVKVLLNHNWNRELANTKDGSAKLEEDNIGLRAEVIITDKEVVEKARNNKLVGWSFGFYPNADEVGKEGEMPTRTLTDLDLAEVSILDDTKSPAYYGTSIETRSEGGKMMEIRDEVLTEEEQTEEKQTEEKRTTEGVDIEQLAEIVATKVVGMLKEERAEKETTEEETTEEETEVEPEVEEKEVEEETETKETQEEETTEETETRAIDYSALEQRIADLK